MVKRICSFVRQGRFRSLGHLDEKSKIRWAPSNFLRWQLSCFFSSLFAAYQNCEEASQCLPEEEDEHIIKITIFVQRFHHGVKHCPEDQLRAAECVEEQEEEKLVVLKADAIVNPRAMMIHL